MSAPEFCEAKCQIRPIGNFSAVFCQLQAGHGGDHLFFTDTGSKNCLANQLLKAEALNAELAAALRELLELGQQESIEDGELEAAQAAARAALASVGGEDFVPRSELERVVREQREACAQSIRGKRMKRREDLALAVFFESAVRATPLVTEVKP